MPFTMILLPMSIWAVVTVIAFYLAQRCKSERATLIAGSFFLIAGVAAPLFCSLFLNEYISCQVAECSDSKVQAQSIIGFFTISWASFGANLLSSLISHK